MLSSRSHSSNFGMAMSANQLICSTARSMLQWLPVLWLPLSSMRAKISKSFNLLGVTVGIVGQFEVQYISHPWIEGQSELSSSSSRVRQKLESLLNKNMRIRMTDGRTLVGLFLCTDRDCNVILGSAQEFLKSSDSFSQGEPRVLGLAMIPGHHVVSIEVESDTLADTQGFGGSH
ncbi:N-alpha-acetyltransferase 38, NatC auxiliary subunit-like isoform X3 [Salvelinus fontinalis]|uniref:N-alpha-acetyltransferase 38, NatC auxiliary subunit-like isoform X3 n=1 Tax=Salvelinus fontinalis TaxID=8038 RepID=UPI002485A824|nr:N-alpha-acetyltransferase 38, NatC auxiliary subunit-like isoform X3 [Salvelinus fontinalis]